MKKIAIIPALIAFFAICALADVKYDPSYSVNNYKHPNKVQIAYQLNLDHLSIYAYAGADNQLFANYKNSFALVDNHGGFVPGLLIDSGTGLASGANYKLQNKTNKTIDKTIEQPNRGPVVLNTR